MKKLFLPVLLIAASLTLAACGVPKGTAPGTATPSAPAADVSQAGQYQTITPEDVKKRMDAGDAFMLIDVRTLGEYNAGHIKGAVNIPVETIVGGKPAGLGDLNAEIILYCQTGNRSAVAAKELLKQGYTKVYDLGGIVDWPYETETSEAPASGDVSPSQSAQSPDTSAGGVLSAFYATDIDGNFVDASIFEDRKLTMVNIWATFCGPCIQEMPELGKLNAEYNDKGFKVVGIVIDASDSTGVPIQEMVDTAKEIIGKTGADYEHLLPSTDLNKAILNTVSAVPTTIFVDDKGNQVGDTYVGSQSGAEWSAIIDSLLKEVA